MCDSSEGPISVALFYGGTPKPSANGVLESCHSRDESRKEKNHNRYPFKYLSVEAPSSAWKVFRKQEDAISFAKKRMNGVVPFVCQGAPGGQRTFVVAHPRVFWFHDCQKKQRSSYEIICQHSLAKLYFDLEFCKETNPDKDGVNMTETFIKVVAYFLFQEWKLEFSRHHILDLDSSTDIKFSRHLIYQLPCIFRDNYHVGNFVKMVCYLLHKIYSGDGKKELMDIGISKQELEELFISDKGKQKLFCDESVYSKNRHFRIYCSSKWGKKAYLIRSQQNQWLKHCEDEDEEVFLDSLITYIPVDTHCTILQYSVDSFSSSYQNNMSRDQNIFFCPENKSESPFPDVDSFVRHLVAPGRVYRWRCSSSQNLVYYDIVGNRYCHNIGREHRSNNIRIVVDLTLKCFYQKCYDPDCRNFQSESTLLPAQLFFSLEGPLTEGGDEDEEEGDGVWSGTVAEEDLQALDSLESNEGAPG